MSISTYKSKAIENHHARAQERIENRNSFIGRNHGVWVFVVWVLYPVGALLSACTAGFYLYQTFSGNVHWSLAAFATLILVTVIEGGKLFFGKGTVDDLQAGSLAGTGPERILLAIKLIAFIGLFGLGIYYSLQGGPMFMEWQKETYEPVAMRLTDEAIAEQEYANDKAIQEDLIKRGQSMTWKKKIIKDGRDLIDAANAELTRINGLIEAKKERIRAENDTAIAAYNEELDANSSRAFAIAGIGELIVFFCIFFIGAFDQEVERRLGGTKGADAGAMEGSKSGARATIGYHSPAVSAYSPPLATEDDEPLVSGRSPIGFGRYSPAASASSPAAAKPSTVETHLDDVDTGNPDSIAAKSHFAAWKTHNANVLSYQNKPETDSVKAGIERHMAMRTYEEEQLALMGLRIELQESPRKRYVLLPL